MGARTRWLGTAMAHASHPAVGRGDKIISQLVASLQFLGAELGYLPPASQASEGLKCALDLADVWAEMYGKRKDAKSWDEVDAWISSRLSNWLKCLTKSIEAFGAGGPYFFGKRITYVDFSCYNVLRNFEALFGAARLLQVSKLAPKLGQIYQLIHKSKQLETFVKTERPLLYASVMHDGKMPFSS